MKSMHFLFPYMESFPLQVSHWCQLFPVMKGLWGLKNQCSCHLQGSPSPVGRKRGVFNEKMTSDLVEMWFSCQPLLQFLANISSFIESVKVDMQAYFLFQSISLLDHATPWDLSKAPYSSNFCSQIKPKPFLKKKKTLGKHIL